MSSAKPLSYAGELVRQYDRDRFLTTLFAPPKARERLLTLYAFNTEIARIRESVSEPLLGQMRLQWWRDLLLALGSGAPPPKGHPVAVPLADLIAEVSLSVPLLLEMVDGREQDMSEEPFESLGALVDYCRQTSSTLSLLALECLGVEDGGTRDVAKSVGLAWALIGTLRSVPHHANGGRMVLPSQMVAEAGLSVQDLQTPACMDSLQAHLYKIGEVAKDNIVNARAASLKIDLRGLPALLPATLAFRYLTAIESRGYNIYHPSIRMQRPAVVRLFWNAWRKRY